MEAAAQKIAAHGVAAAGRMDPTLTVELNVRLNEIRRRLCQTRIHE